MVESVKAGFRGYVELGGIIVRCTDFSVKLSQEALFYDHTIGLRDSVPDSILDTKGDDAEWNEQKIFWRASPKLVEGAISYPLAELSADAFFLEAANGDTLDDLDLYYSCEAGKRFKFCKVNSYAFTATAGEVPSVSVGLMGAYVEDKGAPPIYDIPEKLITWDEVDISGTGADEHIVSFEFSVNNNCMPIYTAGTNLGVGGLADGISPLLVNDIRVGMQTVTGSVTFYNDEGPLDTFVEEQVPLVITITAGLLTVQLNVLYLYPEREGRTNAYIRTIPFHGVELAVQP